MSVLSSYSPVLEFVGNIYVEPQKILNKINQQIDHNYPAFISYYQRFFPNPYRGLYFPDIDMIITPDSYYIIESNSIQCEVAIIIQSN